MILHGNEFGPTICLCRHLQLCKLPGKHRRATQVQNLAGLHRIVERFHRFLNGRIYMARDPMGMPMNYQLVDVVMP